MPESTSSTTSSTTVVNENYVGGDQQHRPVRKTNSTKNVVALPEVNFPTKKFRMRSLLWVKPTGVAVPSTSSLMAQVSDQRLGTLFIVFLPSSVVRAQRLQQIIIIWMYSKAINFLETVEFFYIIINHQKRDVNAFRDNKITRVAAIRNKQPNKCNLWNITMIFRNMIWLPTIFNIVLQFE